MWSTAREIAAGDVVIIWLTREVIQPLHITPGKDFNSKFGNYKHSDFIGIPYGSKVASRTGKGFIHILRPTPELWTLALPHRTQILYLADIAFITSWLNIKRGSRVIEAGTGSGSFSHSVARTVGSAGHLYSYEFHEARAKKASEEFKRHGMDDIVTLTHRNVCKEGFTIVDEADAVFLDLPAPWEAVDYAKTALRKDRTTRICCFSPCMEQVLRTVSALNEAGFTEITMYETLLRPHEVSLVPTLQPIAEVSEKLKKAEAKREEKRLQQIAANKTRSASMKRKREGGTEEDEDEAESKRVKTDDEDAGSKEESSSHLMTRESVEMLVDEEATPMASRAPSLAPPGKMSVSKALPEVRGHTSYLTFACLVPSSTFSAPPPIAAAEAAAPNVEASSSDKIDA
ncbi:tRNA methyltransferase complex GCD14 subunit [Crucibulum laeve]|uniref:tRNA (adenine(58)-N(1))-methyltransferase catalytic subunit TRM61 n=1 Tax=Crucibulum laeve TaxID=68775 RepID=A0A5C3LK85_9AGAR|nr:tRNA methyltransferase complex GCD14 subunit [Crucibulum laeve]